MSTEAEYVEVMPIRGHGDVHRAAVMLVPAFQAANWRWKWPDEPMHYPDRFEIAVHIAGLWRDTRGSIQAERATAGGLSVQRGRGKSAFCVLRVDPKLAKHLQLAGTDSSESPDSKEEGKGSHDGNVLR
jgi:hypothetical protein